MSRDGSEEFGRWDGHGADADAGKAGAGGRDSSGADSPDHDPHGRDLAREDPDSAAERAAWRDLVARLELPSYVDPEHAPWPDQENLRRPAAGQSGPGKARVIRPASQGPVSGLDAPDLTGAGFAYADPEFGYLPDDGYSGYDVEDDRYLPPPLAPLPKLDPVARAAWAALFGGPAFLFAVTMLGWQVPGWTELLAVIAFVAGFSTLVFRLGDGPSRRDGPYQGAIV